MLELQTVGFGYKKQSTLLHDISFTVKQGEFVVIAGRNGSGKTTVTRLIMALRKPVKGSILWEGQTTQKSTPADMARHIGYVFQNPDRQIFHDTVAAEIAYGPIQLNYSAAQVEELVAEALTVTSLGPYRQADPLTLSKGQKQRLAIASALAMQPKMLILDEPTSGQDALERTQLMELLATLHRQGKTILLITHDMDTLAAYAERVVVIHKGCNVFDGGVTELFAHPALADWGLTVPTAVTLSRALAGYGIEQCNTIPKLLDCLADKLGGKSP